MLKLLLRLWADQQRRNFKWGKFFGELYFFALFLIVSIVITVAIYEETGTKAGLEVVATMLAASIITPDFLNKLLMKHDETVMDHYLKSKPIPERDWRRFLLFTNLVSFWNWSIPLLLFPFCILFLSLTTMLSAMLLIVVVSMVGGVAITAFRRAKGWTNKWPVLVAMGIWQMLALFYALLVAIMPWGIHTAGFLLICIGVIAVFYNYLGDLRRYDESKTRTGNVLFGASSLFSMEYISVMRSKRLRVGVLVGLVFVFNAYTQTLNGLNVMFYSMLLFAVFFPSMMLGQWVFGVEGNYFDGLWTKPVDLCQILRNKYLFFGLLNVLSTLPLIPLVWVADLSPWVLFATLVFTIGIGNLILLPTCLISSRLELFQSAFFNYQGASMAVNVYGLVVLLPVVVYCACMWLLTPLVAVLSLTAAGVMGIGLHPLVINRLEQNYQRRRYECFERYRQ